jgi:hypothetical protein
MQQPFNQITSSPLESFPVYMYVLQNYSCNNRCLFFRRLKTNHESHEFILESGTVANNYSLLNPAKADTFRSPLNQKLSDNLRRKGDISESGTQVKSSGGKLASGLRNV